MGGFPWGALIGAGGNSLSTMWGYVGSSKMADKQKSAIRHLRRREYQDMMFSMRQAGLNPMLASGAQPGHAQPSMPAIPSSDIGGAAVKGMDAGSSWSSAKAAHRQAGVAEGKMGSEIAANEGRAGLMAAQVAAQAYTNDLLKAQTAKTQAETNFTLQDTGNIMFKRALLQKQAEKEGASAKQIELLTKQAGLGYNLTPGNMIGHAGYMAGETDREREKTREYHLEDKLPSWGQIGDYIGKFFTGAGDAVKNAPHGD